jgi:hypothetical protein
MKSTFLRKYESINKQIDEVIIELSRQMGLAYKKDMSEFKYKLVSFFSDAVISQLRTVRDDLLAEAGCPYSCKYLMNVCKKCKLPGGPGERRESKRQADDNNSTNGRDTRSSEQKHGKGVQQRLSMARKTNKGS